MAYTTLTSLPVNYKNIIIESTETKTIICSNISCTADIDAWVKEFGIITNTQWNTRKTVPEGVKFACSKHFVCHHSSFHKAVKVDSHHNKKGLSKNAHCTASITAKVKLDTKITRRRDVHVKDGLLGVIVITHYHTHSLNTVETLRFLPADADVQQLFIDYFNDGMGIAEACRHYEGLLELQTECSEESLASGRTNPTTRTVRYWHDNWRLLNLGPRTGEGLIKTLKEKQALYQQEGIIVQFAESPFAAIVVTPLMRRAHQLPSSRNIVFVDSTSACDAENHSITFLLTVSAAGAVPLGIIITKGQSYDAYRQGFHLLQQAVPDGFGGQGYPNIFLTDQAQAEISALSSVWPRSRNLLCIFHVCQAVWRWLWDSKHGIAKEDRPKLMKQFQNILYAETLSEAEEAFTNASEAEQHFPNWQKYISDYWDIKEQWGLAWRDTSSRGHHTNNFSEVTVRLFKDIVLSRVKAYNVIALIDFACTVLEKYYCHRLRNFANTRTANARLLLASMMKKAAYLNMNDIIQIDLQEFHVPSEQDPGQKYIVNIKGGNCSCRMGNFGKFCKHQAGVYKCFDVESFSFPPVNANDRHCIAWLALGENVPPLSFYQPFLVEEDEEVASPAEFVSSNILEGIASSNMSNHDSEETVAEDGVSFSTDSNADVMDKFLHLLKQCNIKFGSTASGLTAIVGRVEKIRTVGQWETFLHTAGKNVPLRRRDETAIRVQPTSLARRKTGVTRGSKRLPAGRPATGEVAKAKRARNFSKNVGLNQPNAKSHGSGH